jgi:hypothetical protein
VAGRVIDGDTRDQATVGVRVRPLDGHDVVFSTHSDASGIALPEDGPFELEVSLQMNVGPGTYSLEAVVWNLVERREWVAGPNILVEVQPDPPSFGRVNLSPDMRLR